MAHESVNGFTRRSSTSDSNASLNSDEIVPPPPQQRRLTDASISSQNSDERVPSTIPRPRRRRVPNSITPIACTNCKKARSKCDGGRPACKRCSLRSVEDTCRYELHAKTAKDLMLREIQQLQRRNEDLEEQHSAFAEKHAWIEQIIRSLRDDGQCIELINRLKRNEPSQSIAQLLEQPLTNSSDPPSPNSEQSLAAAIERYHRDLIESQDPRFWTSTTNDPALIEHLVKLYLTWVHPFHMLFDEGHFVTSFKNCSDTYCSPALVNAICAMGCHLLYESQDNDEQIRSAINDLRGRFLNEARSLMRSLLPDHKLTSIQTWAIMFMVELGSGNGLMASSHLRLACEMLIAKHNVEQSAEANEVASWGILTISTTWSAFMYMKPTVPLSPKKEVFHGISLDDPDGIWRCYRQPEDNVLEGTRGNSMLVACYLAKLYRVIHESILLYCGAHGLVTAPGLMKVWSRFLEWGHHVPQEISEFNANADPVPHVLALHIQYHNALLSLFKPLLYLDQTKDSTRDTISRLVVKHAKKALALLVRYRQMWGAFYQTPIQLFCLVHVCDAIISHDRDAPTTPGTIRFCIESLQEAKNSYPLAGPLLRMFAMSLNDCNIPIANDLERLVGPPSTYQLDELLNACTRPTYKAPISQLLPNMQPSLADDFMDEWQRACNQSADLEEIESPTTATSMDTQRSMDISSLLNHD